MRIRRFPLMLLSAVLVAMSAIGPTAAPATAAYPTTPATVRADLLPAPQINGVVWKQVIAGSTVFAGGEFTQARPFGVASGGTGTVSRSNLLAYSLTTGVLDPSFHPTFNGKVADMAVTPDGTKLVVVGNFTQVNGVTRNRIAMFDVATKALITPTVVPNANASIKGVAVTNSTIFLGGSFSTINAAARSHVASVLIGSGAVQALKVPVDNGTVTSIVVSPDGTQIVIGGNFTTVGGSSNPGYGLYRANSTTGAALALPVNSTYRVAGTNSAVQRLASDSTSFYGGGYAYHSNGGTGNSEGFFQASWSTGALVNLEDCHGDTYDIAPIGDVVYQAGHHHYCGNSGGFPQTEPWTLYHSTAWTKATEGVNTRDRYGYPDHPGTPRPGILNWFPQYQVGTYTGMNQATWSVTGNSNYVLYGGEFPKVDNIAQQGIVRFAVHALAPNKTGPRATATAPFTPTATSTTPGQVRVTWPAAWDRDDYTLTYRLYRNGTQIYQTSQGAFFWTGQPMSYTDTGQASGSKPSYVVRAVDPDGNTLSSTAATVTVKAIAGLNPAETPLVGKAATPSPTPDATPDAGVVPTPGVDGLTPSPSPSPTP